MFRKFKVRQVQIFGLLVLAVVSGPSWLAAATRSVDQPAPLEAAALNPALKDRTIILYFTNGGSQRGVCKGSDQDSITLEVNGKLHIYELAFVREIEIVQ
jgi:hypothetical protein